LNWSPDGSEIYFDRVPSVPRGIYTVSRFGGDEHLVLEDAMGPEVLPDGTLLVVRVNKDRGYQLYRFWPDSGRLDALDAFFLEGQDVCPPVRAFRDRKDAVVFAKTEEQDKADPFPHLYVIDLTSVKTRRLEPELEFRRRSSLSLFPLAISPDDEFVLAAQQVGDLFRVISIGRSGEGPVRTLFTVTMPLWFMDVDKDGRIYLDQGDRPLEVLRFSPSGGTPETLAGPLNGSFNKMVTLQLSDGRVVLNYVVAGRSRLVAVSHGGDAIAFIATKEETSMPACRVGEAEVAFLLGSPRHVVLALASITDGRIVRRLEGVPADQVTSLAASPDGKTLYYVASGSVWAIPVSGGQSLRIASGNAVAPDPNGGDLIVQLIEKEGVRLSRVPVSGGAGRPITFQSALSLAPIFIGLNAVGRDGRVVLCIDTADSWFYGAGILDPRTGKLEKIPLSFTGEVQVPGWLDDGHILSSAWPLRATLWRFRPVANKTSGLLP